MYIKSFIAAAAVAATAALSTVSAEAKPKFDVDVYVGGFEPGYYDPGFGYYDPPAPHPRPRPQWDDDYAYDGISCEQGRQEVRYSGFRKVRPLDCNGRRYTYRARRGGEVFIVKVSSRSGDIVSVQPAY